MRREEGRRRGGRGEGEGTREKGDYVAQRRRRTDRNVLSRAGRSIGGEGQRERGKRGREGREGRRMAGEWEAVRVGDGGVEQEEGGRKE